MIELSKRIIAMLELSVGRLSVQRSAAWKSLRKRHLRDNPRCEACGSTENVVPHHVVPVRLDPSKELDPNNLVSLCEGRTFNCHLFFGHLKRWDRHNPKVFDDAKAWRARIEESDFHDRC